MAQKNEHKERGCEVPWTRVRVFACTRVLGTCTADSQRLDSHCSRFSCGGSSLRERAGTRSHAQRARGIVGKRKEDASPLDGKEDEGRVGIVGSFCPCRNKRSRKSFEARAAGKDDAMPLCVAPRPTDFIGGLDA